MFIAKEGKLEYAAQYESTLPDNMEKAAAICDGKYEIKSGLHKGHAALWLNDNNDIEAFNSIKKNDTVNYIHFHMAGLLLSDELEKPYSEGYMVIDRKYYDDTEGYLKFNGSEEKNNDGS